MNQVKETDTLYGCCFSASVSLAWSVYYLHNIVLYKYITITTIVCTDIIILYEWAVDSIYDLNAYDIHFSLYGMIPIVISRTNAYWQTNTRDENSWISISPFFAFEFN